VDDIRRHDQKLFTAELIKPTRLVLSLIFIAIGGGILFNESAPFGLLILAAAAGWHVYRAYQDSIAKRWLHARFKSLWSACEDRLDRFDEVLDKMRKDQLADLYEMPKTIHGVGDSLYAALRRADIISHDVLETEKGILQAPPAWQAPSADAQARELYRIADKNIAEYRHFYGGVMSGVQRAEAQAAVFMTTLDSLRMKMIGYRLVGKQPELSSQEFLEALSEARLQLTAIDRALDELDFSHFPKMISAMTNTPPPFDPERAAAYQSEVDRARAELNQE
jgi:hypothetical protein